VGDYCEVRRGTGWGVECGGQMGGFGRGERDRGGWSWGLEGGEWWKDESGRGGGGGGGGEVGGRVEWGWGLMGGVVEMTEKGLSRGLLGGARRGRR